MAARTEFSEGQRFRGAPEPHNMGSFHYNKLDTRDTFRLLKLHAGRGDRIECSLHHYELGSEDCPLYTALSYTWDEDPARFDVHMPHDTGLLVRENLRNALRFLRDIDTDCYLWIDAICIDQRSNVERNHQVKLMADIYRQANIVVVWLQSAGESADVSKAFQFMRAAVNHDRSEHSTQRYCKAHGYDNESEWISVEKFFRLRYWTRKWIIQELLSARTVVLQVGDTKCPMTDFETFCRQLQRLRNDDIYRSMTGAVRRVLKFAAESSAARLALQRLETSRQQQPRLLYELIERYADNQCKMACDHIYALYSLAGDHRQNLRINYDATLMQQLVDVLRFAHTYEQLPPARTLAFATLLRELLRIRQGDFDQERDLAERLNLVVPASILGTVELLLESDASESQRSKIQALHPMPKYSFDTSREVWCLIGVENGRPQETVGRTNMAYFEIADSHLQGLAACPLRAGDTILHLPMAPLVFAIRERSDSTAYVLGRAYLFQTARNPDVLEPWTVRPDEYDRVRKGERSIALSLATLLHLGELAIPAKRAETSKPDNEKPRYSMIAPRINHLRVSWRGDWWDRIITAASGVVKVLHRRIWKVVRRADELIGLIFIFVLTIILLRVT